MQITNNHKLPEPLYQAIVAQSKAHSVGAADLSCTELIDSPLIRWLWREHGDEVVEDAGDRLWPLYGSIAHSIMEKYQGEGHHIETEAIAQVGALKISGHIDLIVFPDGTLQDYKFTSGWSIEDAIKKGMVKPEWERQLNVYRYLLKHDPFINLPPISRLQIVAMIRDYGPRHSSKLQPVEILEVPVWTDEDTQAYMEERVKLHLVAMGPDVPPQCSPAERWENYKGESKRCEGYCPFGKQGLCPYIG